MEQILELTHPTAAKLKTASLATPLKRRQESANNVNQITGEVTNANKSELVLIPRTTIHPDRIILYKEAKWIGCKPHKGTAEDQENKASEVNQSFLHSQRKNNGFLSTHAKRKLNRSLDYMICTSEKKKAFSKLQRKYVVYRVVFVTLTLPSKQVHSDKEITNKLWNQFITELKMYENVKRYVWRAEKQENGNIHYHLLINQFIEWQELRKRWNRITNKLGYVDTYQKQMTEFYQNGFRPSNNPNDKRSIEQQRKAYIIGQKSHWTSPNSTDIHDTRKIKDVKRYVQKYMSKQPEVDLENIESFNENLQVNGRLWSSSHDLANPTGLQLTEDWQISDELEKIVAESKCRSYVDTYFSVYYIDFQKLAKLGTGLLYKYFSDYLNQTFNFQLQQSIAL